MKDDDDVLRITNLTFKYPSSPVLFDKLNLGIQGDGEVKCVLGPSGVGKSTLIYLILGVLEPESGSIEIDGSQLPVFQNFESMLLRWFSARDNICWGLNEHKDKELRNLCEMLEISEKLDILPRDLSGGQKQRVILARALIRQPGLLLLDEPLANLDAGTLRRVLPRIRDFLKRKGISALWVTHNIHEALDVSDSILVLGEQGKVEELPVSATGANDSLTLAVQKLLR
ncbi:MAG: ATP-binding cassette domain-containing protein [Candidatus Binatia bacterium]